MFTNLKKKFETDARAAAETARRIGKRKAELGPTAKDFGPCPDAKRRVREKQQAVEEAKKRLDDMVADCEAVLKEYEAAVEERKSSDAEVERTLVNPALLLPTVVAGRQQANVFALLSHEGVRIIAARLAATVQDGNAANMVVAIRRALSFVDAETVIAATKPLWGVLGSALVARAAASIVVPKGTICIATNAEGETVALYRVNPAIVAVYNVDQNAILHRLDCPVVQARDGTVAPDAGTMELGELASYYVVNFLRFTAEKGGKVVKKRITQNMVLPEGFHNGVRINRFVDDDPNTPFTARAPTLVPTQQKSPPFYMLGSTDFANPVVEIGGVVSNVIDRPVEPDHFYAESDEDGARISANKYPDALKDQCANIVATPKFFKMDPAATGTAMKIRGVARFGSLLFVQPRSRNDPTRLAILPLEEDGSAAPFRALSIEVYADDSGMYAAIPGDMDGNRVTVIARLVEKVVVGGTSFTAYHAMRSVYDIFEKVAVSPGTPAERRSRARKKIKSATGSFQNRRDPLVVKGHLVAVAGGPRTCIQFDGALIRLNCVFADLGV